MNEAVISDLPHRQQSKQPKKSHRKSNTCESCQEAGGGSPFGQQHAEMDVRALGTPKVSLNVRCRRAFSQILPCWHCGLRELPCLPLWAQKCRTNLYHSNCIYICLCVYVNPLERGCFPALLSVEGSPLPLSRPLRQARAGADLHVLICVMVLSAQALPTPSLVLGLGGCHLTRKSVRGLDKP